MVISQSILIPMIVTAIAVIWGYWPTRYPLWFSFLLMICFTSVCVFMIGVLAQVVILDDLSALTDADFKALIRAVFIGAFFVSVPACCARCILGQVGRSC